MTSLSEDIRHAADLLREVRDVTIVAHIRPDADTLGSAFALGRILRRRGASVRVSFSGDNALPESLQILDSDGLYVPEADLPNNDSFFVAVDVSTLDRLGVLATRVPLVKAAGGEVLVIDHHASNTRFGTHNVVDDKAEATVVLIMKIIDELAEPLDEFVAQNLYAGLFTDTGGFRRATPETHNFAARLLATGIKSESFIRKIVDEQPFSSLPLIGRVLSEARLDTTAARGLGMVHAVITPEIAAELSYDEAEGIVNLIRSTREADVAAILKFGGFTDNELTWNVSLRSAGGIDVSAAVIPLGGGGHRVAAGCTMIGTADDVLHRLRQALEAAPLL